MTKPLANYLSPDLSEARLARQYGNIREQTKRGGRLPRWSVLALAGALGAAGLLAVILFFSPPRPPAPSPLDGTIAESRAGGELLTLPEGTRMRLDAQTRMRMTTVHANLVRVVRDRGVGGRRAARKPDPRDWETRPVPSRRVPCGRAHNEACEYAPALAFRANRS